MSGLREKDPEWLAVIEALHSLLGRDPKTKRELAPWNAEANALMRRIQLSASISDRVPELVWHFLADADIRVKDSDYAEMQQAELRQWLEPARQNTST